MKMTACCGRIKWAIETPKGGEVTITKRETDFFIKYDEMVCQCPYKMFSIGGNIDKFSELSSKENQTLISVGMKDIATGLSLLCIHITNNEIAEIKKDSILSKYLSLSFLEKEDCFITSDGLMVKLLQ